MPYKQKDATRFTKKAKSPRKKRQFAAAANSMLARGKSEGSAIRVANSVVTRSHPKKSSSSGMDRYASKRMRELKDPKHSQT